MIPRRLIAHIQELLRYYPAISVTGPRQAGKTTLLRSLLSDYTYLSFETPDVRQDFLTDPKGFIRQYGEKVIFDEAQHVPELFSYLQTNIDLDRRPGRFVLSGSQNFLLRKNITQSLAGRIGIARLLPLDLQEKGLLEDDGYLRAIINGSYPEQFVRQIPPKLFYANYIYSYVQRDVAGLIDPKSMAAFERFMGLLAGQSGQLLNLSSLSTAVGISVPTVKSWLSILEQSYIVFQLTPYYKSMMRRLVKSPKVYFYDTGLLCHLLRIRTNEQLKNHYHFGSIFENFIVADAYKSTFHQGEQPGFHFYRDSNGAEVDLVYEDAAKQLLWEIKATETYHPRLVRKMKSVAKSIFPNAVQHLIYTGAESVQLDGVERIPWQEVSWEIT
ncbi:MAG: ATP-binding protein [Bacteroidota bacterium]